MSYYRQHAIVVTSDGADVVVAHNKAQDMFPVVSDLLHVPGSNYHSFFVPPDGHKESSDESKWWDAISDEFIEWMRAYRADAEDVEYGGNSLRWVEVQFGDEDLDTKVLRSSDHDLKEQEEAEAGQSSGLTSRCSRRPPPGCQVLCRKSGAARRSRLNSGVRPHVTAWQAAEAFRNGRCLSQG
jgi:hypothetical protein